jgi:uncharacterized alkaline shock family protein YloU
MTNTDTTSEKSRTGSTPESRTGSSDPRREIEAKGNGSQLQTEQGKTSISDSVVTKIAGVATREISGVHDMGTGGARMFGAIKSKLPVGSDTPSPSRGVNVEVGERQAAVDLDVVVDYGVSIVDVAEAIRGNVIRRVEVMTGLEVTEVNIAIDDVWLGEEEEEPRVQ